MSSGYKDIPSTGSVFFSSATITYAQLNAAHSGVKLNSNVSIPTNAFVINSSMDFTVEFTGNGDSGSLFSAGIGAPSDNIQASYNITAIGAGIEQGYSLFAGGGAINATWTAAGTDTALTAGSVTIYVEWTIL